MTRYNHQQKEQQSNLPIFLDVDRTVIVIYGRLVLNAVFCASLEVRAVRAAHLRIAICRYILVFDSLSTENIGRRLGDGSALGGGLGLGLGWRSGCYGRGCRLRGLFGFVVAVFRVSARGRMMSKRRLTDRRRCPRQRSRRP